MSCKFQLGTKAESLEGISTLIKSASVPELIYFNLKKWNSGKKEILETIVKNFSGNFIAIRSSCKAEDTLSDSMAGAFESILSINSSESTQVEEAIDKVAASFDSNPDNQILIQNMVLNVAVCGVITTKVIDDGSPYYVINYDDESGKTDTITGGTGVHKAVLIHRSAPRAMIESPRLARWLLMAQEIEGLCNSTSLDIEFAEDKNGNLFLLQVRPLATTKNWNRDVFQLVSNVQDYIVSFIKTRKNKRSSILGNNLILGEMPDWNPAEMIGTTPRPLAVSMYRYLITDEVWRTARHTMGYKNPINETLMVILCGRPYIDVRNSFNSFLPENITPQLGEKLVDAWLDRLNKNPHLHDKVEFDVAQTVLDFQFEQNFSERYPDLLSRDEFNEFKNSLKEFTLKNLSLSESESLKTSLKSIGHLEKNQKLRQLNLKNQSQIELIDTLVHLIRECKSLGTFHFAIIARHAFIAESFLQTAIARGALNEDRVSEFKRSLKTITSSMTNDFAEAAKNTGLQKDFLKKYGHLRPGTYDIQSARYDQRDDLFSLNHELPIKTGHDQFNLLQEEASLLNKLLAEAELSSIEAHYLLEYCSLAIRGREHAKFIFTKNLSDALETIAAWAEKINLNRDDVSYISISHIIDTLTNPILSDEQEYFKEISIKNKSQMEITKSLHIGYIIRDERDLFVIPLHRSAPNFITRKKIEAEKIIIANNESGHADLKNKIVCIENADPGYDWIFTRDIAGLITKFGGKNSHMAIRCAELDLPAAIGCGEHTFERLKKSPKIMLDCSNKKIEPVI